MWTTLLFGLVATSHLASAKGGRKNGDTLEVGARVRIHVMVEEDYYFGVVACGKHQCGGVRVDGVDSMGMGYRSFLSNATNHPFQATWVIREDSSFGTQFVPGREYTFVVARPVERLMQVWIEGKEERVAGVKLSPGLAQLHIAFKNGIYRFTEDGEDSEPGSKQRPKCTVSDRSTLDLARNTDTDVLELKVGCRYESEDKVDSMCIIYFTVEGVKGRKEVYRSRIMKDVYDPDLQEIINVPFQFEEKQNLVCEVYRGYSDCDVPDEKQHLGTMVTQLGVVNSRRKVELSVSQPNDSKYYALFQLNCDQRITLQLSGRALEGEGDVFFKILKSTADGQGDKYSSFEEVAESNKVKRDIDLLTWDEITLSVDALCDGDYKRNIRIYVLDSIKGESRIIGYFNTSLNELKQPQSSYLLIDNKKRDLLGESYNHSGLIWVGEIPPTPTFSQYVAVGFELVGTTQIDFTGSNNEPVPSLHHIGKEPNKYEIAIKAVGEVIENFIRGRVFKAYGFGARFHGVDVLQDFNLNLDPRSPDCVGVSGVLEAYHRTVGKLDMEGPTIFAPVLNKILDMARQYQDGSKYFVHLLLTDGLLHDPEETKKAILEASNLPVSIIMVGIGDSDFSAMKAVATDAAERDVGGVKFWNDGERAARDVVQFVAMKDFLGVDHVALERSLGRKVLAKIPPQYLEYMKIKKIPPKPPRNTTLEKFCS